MKTLPIYQVDAFSKELFGGNPAAVCPLKEWLPDAVMQKIALENNLSETAFIVGSQGRYHIRWFTPGTEVKLCGHATLAASYVIHHELGDHSSRLVFDSLSGELTVSFKGRQIELDFPAADIKAADLPESVAELLPFEPEDVVVSQDDFLIVAPDEETIINLDLDFTKLEKGLARGICISAKSNRPNTDFVSRWFGGPEVAIQEDPVTGSAHTMLVPYWAPKLNSSSLIAEQISARRGRLECTMQNNRVLIAGYASLYLKGEIYIF
ncbi:isomerase [Endozoicomonas sp. OPT23]|uniref:PhzF family phenazine biosynthesis protein n=1 Tax=Endozoicomonas sp. OPT23 TaxID=2072845 RepID=UPI00129B24B8|nr:PhzF family phenazine biosynthesis protein [Endozoicomonas sp. OPT23]MRI32864.1 isomerase [Endozoicomonas sp. OPT23]